MSADEPPSGFGLFKALGDVQAKAKRLTESPAAKAEREAEELALAKKKESLAAKLSELPKQKLDEARTLAEKLSEAAKARAEAVQAEAARLAKLHGAVQARSCCLRSLCRRFLVASSLRGCLGPGCGLGLCEGCRCCKGKEAQRVCCRAGPRPRQGQGE